MHLLVWCALRDLVVKDATLQRVLSRYCCVCFSRYSDRPTYHRVSLGLTPTSPSLSSSDLFFSCDTPSSNYHLYHALVLCPSFSLDPIYPFLPQTSRPS